MSTLTASDEHLDPTSGEAAVRMEGNKTPGFPASSPGSWGQRPEGWHGWGSESFLRHQGKSTVTHLCPKQTWGTVDKSPTGDATDEKLDLGTRAGSWRWKKEGGFRIRELILLKHKSLRGEHFSC